MNRHIRVVPAAWRTTAIALTLGASVLALPGAALAGSAPANDSFSAATQIAYLPFEDSYVDNTSATLEDGESDVGCFGDIGSTVWYRISPSSSYAIRVRVVPVTDIDTVVAVFDGTSFDNLFAISCADEFTNHGTETAIAPLVGGRSYYIQVGGWTHTSANGQFTVKVKRAPGPANDHFANSAALALGSLTTANTTTATLEAAESPPSCGPTIGRTVWYRYTPTTTRTLVANTVGSGFDTILAAYTGPSIDSLTEVACNDDRPRVPDLMSKIRFTAIAGHTYYFQVGGFWAQGGDLVLRLKTP